ncbi:MAG: hypothetical protein Q4D85_07620, partial [Corynebacterium sp.]|nr:hypothetical protein [Corynebacterium sp.]
RKKPMQPLNCSLISRSSWFSRRNRAISHDHISFITVNDLPIAKQLSANDAINLPDRSEVKRSDLDSCKMMLSLQSRPESTISNLRKSSATAERCAST